MKKETFEKILAMGNNAEHIEAVTLGSGKAVFLESGRMVYHPADGTIEIIIDRVPNPAQPPFSYLMEVDYVESVRLRTDKIATQYDDTP